MRRCPACFSYTTTHSHTCAHKSMHILIKPLDRSIASIRSSIGQNPIVAEDMLKDGFHIVRRAIPEDVSKILLDMHAHIFSKKIGNAIHHKEGPRMIRVQDKYSSKHEQAENCKTIGVMEMKSQTLEQQEAIAHVKNTVLNLIKDFFRKRYGDEQADSLTIEDISSPDLLTSKLGSVTVSYICMICFLCMCVCVYIRVSCVCVYVCTSGCACVYLCTSGCVCVCACVSVYM